MKNFQISTRDAEKLLKKLQTIRKEITEDGIMEDIALFESDPIRMVEEGVVKQVHAILKGEDLPAFKEEDENQLASIYVSSIIEAEHIIHQMIIRRKKQLAQVKNPIQNSIDKFVRISSLTRTPNNA